MIYLKLRQAGQRVNHKRVERLYAEAGLQVRRRRRKKVPVSDRHPLGRPERPIRFGRWISYSTGQPKGVSSNA